MAGQKRTRSGEIKPRSKPQELHPQTTFTTSTTPYGQVQPPSSKTISTHHKTAKANKQAKDDAEPNQKTKPRMEANRKNTYVPRTHGPLKRPRLPVNATISKRPLLHPAIPTPFSSAESPKVLYITASSPFIPTCKRIRSLLVQVQKRAAQSTGSASRGRGHRAKENPEANGRLEAKDVEAAIADRAKVRGKGKDVRGEEIFVKATGRAIPRALELGVKFQGEEDCKVRIEMGSVKAIDDVEVKEGADGEGEGDEDGDEVPETRIRTLSTVTVCIGLK